MRGAAVENLSLFALIYLNFGGYRRLRCWESFIIRLDILMRLAHDRHDWLRIFHYSPWYTYTRIATSAGAVENLSLFALIYLHRSPFIAPPGWESFIIRLDILIARNVHRQVQLRIFHYSPWYTYVEFGAVHIGVENLSLFALIYLESTRSRPRPSWESFIIRLDILRAPGERLGFLLRIFHYSPWYT